MRMLPRRTCNSLIADGGVEAEGGSDEILDVTILHTTDTHNHANGYGAWLDYTPFGRFGWRPGSWWLRKARHAHFHDSCGAANRLGFPCWSWIRATSSWGTVFDMTAANPVAFRYFDAVGYDAVCLGNHEFDWSPAGLSATLDGALGTNPDFAIPILASQHHHRSERRSGRQFRRPCYRRVSSSRSSCWTWTTG